MVQWSVGLVLGSMGLMLEALVGLELGLVDLVYLLDIDASIDYLSYLFYWQIIPVFIYKNVIRLVISCFGYMNTS